MKANLLIDSAHRIIEMKEIMSLSLERSPFIKQIAGASEKWKINVSAELKTLIFKIEGIDLLHSFIVILSHYILLLFQINLQIAECSEEQCIII